MNQIQTFFNQLEMENPSHQDEGELQIQQLQVAWGSGHLFLQVTDVL